MTTSAAALHAIPRMNAGWCRISKKMLYDNALLTHVYVEAYQVTGDDHYRRVACETLDYILKEMTSPEGGFLFGHRRRFRRCGRKIFVWTPEEVRAALDNEEDATGLRLLRRDRGRQLGTQECPPHRTQPRSRCERSTAFRG